VRLSRAKQQKKFGLIMIMVHVIREALMKIGLAAKANTCQNNLILRVASKPSVGLYHLINGVVVNMAKEHNGAIKWPDGRDNKGSIGSDLNPNGKRKRMFANKNVYEGEWRQGLMNDKGTYIWDDGRKYEGTIYLTQVLIKTA
jgi:hypothetical protein